MIKNIVFDLGNVLLKGHSSIVLEELKLTDEMSQNIKSTFFSNCDDLDLGNESIKEHFDRCEFDYNIDESIKEILVNYFKYRPFNNEMIELINKLKENGYMIYILSNNNKETYKYLKSLPIFECIDGWIVSCDYHMVKPDKGIYMKLFETFNLIPEECYFVDDKKENIGTAKLLGMQGFVLDIQNQGIDSLVEKMKEQNIVV